ncbi:MAG: hypothetical protein ACRD38_01290 [Nitrososphaerales archaeon]
MSEEEKKERDEDDDEDDEELTDEQRKKRRLKRLLEKLAEKDFKNGRKVDDGFQGAFGGQENAHKYYRHHNFTYTAEPTISIPEVKPTAVSGPRAEQQRWYPHISQPTENPIKNEEVESASDKLFRFMEDLSEDERREIWDSFYEQTKLEEFPEDDLVRIEAEAKSEITPDNLSEPEQLTKSLEEERIRSRWEFENERMEASLNESDYDIERRETLRKLGHGPGRCVPPDSVEEVY